MLRRISYDDGPTRLTRLGYYHTPVPKVPSVKGTSPPLPVSSLEPRRIPTRRLRRCRGRRHRPDPLHPDPRVPSRVGSTDGSLPRRKLPPLPVPKIRTAEGESELAVLSSVQVQIVPVGRRSAPARDCRDACPLGRDEPAATQVGGVCADRLPHRCHLRRPVHGPLQYPARRLLRQTGEEAPGGRRLRTPGRPTS